MNAARLQTVQGILFCVVALGVALASYWLPRLETTTELMLVAMMVLVLGVPHGALDTMFAENLYRVRSFSGWLLFTLAYFLPAVLIVALWFASPSVFLVGFLIISMIHFSGDLSPGTPLITRMLYGGCVIVLPTLIHASELEQLFSLLVGSAAAKTVLFSLHILQWPWLIGIIAAALQRTQRDCLSGTEIAAVAVIAVLAPPLIAFAVFFCFMHSARHILRTVDYFANTPAHKVMTAAFLPMVITICLAAVLWTWLGNVSWNARVLQILFVGLAALTVPHMGMIERVRLSGWKNTVK